MARKELEDWLQSDESKSVGQGEGQSKGYEPGRKIVRILGKSKSDYTGSFCELRHDGVLRSSPTSDSRRFAETGCAVSLPGGMLEGLHLPNIYPGLVSSSSEVLSSASCRGARLRPRLPTRAATAVTR